MSWWQFTPESFAAFCGDGWFCCLPMGEGFAFPRLAGIARFVFVIITEFFFSLVTSIWAVLMVKSLACQVCLLQSLDLFIKQTALRKEIASFVVFFSPANLIKNRERENRQAQELLSLDGWELWAKLGGFSGDVLLTLNRQDVQLIGLFAWLKAMRLCVPCYSLCMKTFKAGFVWWWYVAQKRMRRKVSLRLSSSRKPPPQPLSQLVGTNLLPFFSVATSDERIRIVFSRRKKAPENLQIALLNLWSD